MENSKALNNYITAEFELDSLLSKEQKSSVDKKANAYYLKNSQYLKKEDRDPVLIKSYEREGYLIPISRFDILQKYQDRYSYELVYENIVEVSIPIQKLLTLRSWKKEEQKKKFLEISTRCLQLGIKIKESKTHSDIILNSFQKEYKDLEIQLHQINEELNYQKQISKNEQWDIPLPLPEELHPVEAFVPEMLPDALQGWILDIADRMQIPPDFSAASCIVVLSSLIGRKMGIYPKSKDDWFVIPNLWGAIIGKPSLLKSPAIAEVMKPLDYLVEGEIENYQKNIHSYEEHLMILDAEKSAFKDLLRQTAKRAIKQNSSIRIDEICTERHHFETLKPPILIYLVI